VEYFSAYRKLARDATYRIERKLGSLNIEVKLLIIFFELVNFTQISSNRTQRLKLDIQDVSAQRRMDWQNICQVWFVH
jgi:hypothetical protein